MKQVDLTIIENCLIADGTYRMVLAGDVSGITAPGQFINLALPGHFLRRPISVCDVSREVNKFSVSKQEFLERLEREAELMKSAADMQSRCIDCGALEYWEDSRENSSDSASENSSENPLENSLENFSDNSLEKTEISISSGIHSSVTILYKIAGKGTAEMAELPVGTILDVLTGLGNGFDISRVKEGQRALLLGGGIGSAPMLMLTKELMAHGVKVSAVLGFNTAGDVILAEDLQRAGAEVTVMTADGSIPGAEETVIAADGSIPGDEKSTIFYGKGFVTDAGIVKSGDYDYFYACGPMPMLKAVYRTCTGEGELSFEERMGCGFGACMGCSMQTASGPKRVCKDGPVFRRSELLWDAE